MLKNIIHKNKETNAGDNAGLVSRIVLIYPGYSSLHYC